VSKSRKGHIDTFIGQRIRGLRIQRGINQSQLGEALGVSFQQIQKYERGINRVSTSALIAIATALQVPPGYFYEGAPGLKEPSADAAPSPVDEFMSTRDGVMIADAFVAIADPAVRHAVADAIANISRALAPKPVTLMAAE
jgi:transcriptional regulator with XRE-family HTH domain